MTASTYPTAASAAAGSLQEFHGTIFTTWGDPDPESSTQAYISHSLTTTDGTIVPLDMGENDALAVNFFGKSVIIAGELAASGTAGRSVGQSIVVESITAAPGAFEARAVQTTTRKVLFLLLRYSDDTAVPHPPQFYLDLTNPDTPPPGAQFPTTINGFFRKTSFDALSWIADVGGVGGVPATDWLVLPHPKTHYAPCGTEGSCSDRNAIATDGFAAGEAAGIDFSVYDNINFVLSNDLDCCAWGGGRTYEGKSFGVTWVPPWGHETELWAHELGHSLGLPHSGWVYYAYDSPWDVMSDRNAATAMACGSYASKNSGTTRTIYCKEPGNGYIGPHKDHLGWLPPENIVLTNSASSLQVTLEASALPLGEQAKLAKICIPCENCTGPDAHYFTVEARVGDLGADSQYDNAIPADGVIIHEIRRNRPAVSGPCFSNSQSGWAIPVDATPGDWNASPTCAGTAPYPNYALFNAHWLPGQTFTDPATGLAVQVVSREDDSYVVHINPSGAPDPTASCDDANPCTDDSCDADQGCTHVPNSAPCDDGKFCTQTDVCSNSACVGSGNPCAAGSECNNSCNEGADNCFSTTGTACTSDSNPCTLDQCNGSGSCAHPAGNAGTTCRASAGICDVAESCTGASTSCPVQGFVSSANTCRPANGVCDVAETCTGTSAPCPANDFASSASVCRVSAGICDPAETCTGTSGTCPADSFAGSAVVCRPGGGICDSEERCSGANAACPANGFAPSSIVCRASGGVCDVAETCTGLAGACPVDSVAGAAVTCRAAAGECDVAEVCDGTLKTCSANAFAGADTPCSADVLPCTEEVCSGTSAACTHPAGNPGTACRTSAGVCDMPETCNGTSTSCPADAFASSATACRASTGVCDVAETCPGSDATCPADSVTASSATCRASAGECDVAERCSGTSKTCPADVVADADRPCTSDGLPCTRDVCSGEAIACTHVAGNAGAVCRASSGVCDVAETCSGSSATCPTDGFVGAGTTCRASTGVCDAAETCSGSSSACPADGFQPSGTVCRAAAGICDVAETCSGTSSSCPADVVATSAVVCRSGAGECDLAESCSGTGKTCGTDAFVAANAGCTQDGNICTNDICNGASAACQHPGNSGPCNDNVFCNGADTCSGGACSVHAGDPCPGPDGDADCSESCSEAADACIANDPDGSACDDGRECTTGEQCLVGQCEPDVDMCAVTTTTLEELICGDANGDGRITAPDALLALKMAVGTEDCPLEICDWTGDDKVTALDALMILRKAVGQAVVPNCPAAAAPLSAAVSTTLSTIPTATVPDVTTTLPR